MIEKRLKKVAILTAIFAVISLSAMFYRMVTKNILIAEATGEQVQIVEGKSSYKLEIDKTEDESFSGKLMVPVEKEVNSDQIRTQDLHVDHKFLLYIDGKETDFYTKEKLKSGAECVLSAECAPIGSKGKVCMIISMDDFYITSTELVDDAVMVSFEKKTEPDENVVLIDPVDDTGIELSHILKKKLDEIPEVTAYFTRVSGTKRDEDKIKKFADEAGVTFYIQIGSESINSEESGVKTLYNDRFFIRNFGNVQLADELEKAVAEATGVDARGLFSVPEDNKLLKSMTIPSAYVVLGNHENAVDEKLLTNDSYLESYAKGMAAGIKNAFNIVNPMPEEDTDALQGIIHGN